MVITAKYRGETGGGRAGGGAGAGVTTLHGTAQGKGEGCERENDQGMEGT